MEKEIQKKLSSLNVAIVTHTRADGLSQHLRDFLLPQVKSLIFIGHPLYPDKKNNSSMQIYKNGLMVNDFKTGYIVKDGILLFIKDFFLTLYFLIRSGRIIDLAIGVDNLNTSALLILRKMGLIKKVIYHTVDYVPNRFSNKFLNNIYHDLDRFCCYNADILWNSSGRMNEGRVRFGADAKKIAKTIVTPDGSNFDEDKRLPIEKINRKTVAFVGHLRERLGLSLLIDSWGDVVGEIPDAKLLIIGGGPLLQNLKRQASGLKNITFTGFIENHEDVDEKLRHAAIGIAMFESVVDSYEYYSDAGKPKVYLAAGLPVVITRVPEIADEIEDKDAGIVTEYNKKELSDSIITLLKNDKEYLRKRENAINLSKKYIWPNIFRQAFADSI